MNGRGDVRAYAIRQIPRVRHTGEDFVGLRIANQLATCSGRPETAALLLIEAQSDVDLRWKLYQHWANIPYGAGSETKQAVPEGAHQ